MSPQVSGAGGFRGFAERAIPFLRDEGDKYEDDGANEPLELAREIDHALASNPTEAAPAWSRRKPQHGGVYGVRGFNLGEEPEDQFEAIVAVRLFDDELVCNLHELTSEDDFTRWCLVSDLCDSFEWCEFVAIGETP